VLALTNVRLIDGTGRDPIENTAIVIDGNRIKNIGPVTGYPDNANEDV
jgi:cytosine/adenosine deaminase-related metal-dependent hydrolase